MEFILNLLLLNGRVFTRKAVNTVHAAFKKYMRLQRKIQVEYNHASCMVGPFGNMLEFINYHVGEIENEAENYLISGEIKCKVYDHFNRAEPGRYMSVSSKNQRYKPISEPVLGNPSSENEKPTGYDKGTPSPAIKRKRKLDNDVESRKKIKEEEFLVENLSAILKSQEFLFKNICKLMKFFENSQLNVDPKKLAKIKQKLHVCKQVLSSPRLPQRLDEKAIDEMIEGEVTRCRLASAEISKIPRPIPRQLSQDSKVAIVASSPNPMPIKTPKPDILPIKKKKEDPAMLTTQQKTQMYPHERTHGVHKQINNEPKNKVEMIKAKPSIEMKTSQEVQKPTGLYNQPQFSSPIKFPKSQPLKRASSSEEKFKIIAKAIRENRRRPRRGNSAPFRMSPEKSNYKTHEFSYNSELVPLYFDQSFKPSVFKFKKLSRESQVESNDNMKQLLEKNEAHLYKFENCLEQALVSQKLLSITPDCLNMCKCDYYNKRHFKKIEAKIVEKVAREQVQEHFHRISSKNLSHFNRIEARIAQNLAMEQYEESRENLGKAVLSNDKRFNLVEKQISETVARRQEAEVLDINKEYFKITDRNLQAVESKNQFGQLLAVNQKQFVKAEKEIDQKLIQLKNDLLKLLPRSIQIETRRHEDELLLNMNIHEFDKFEKKVETIAVHENLLRSYPLLSRYERESLMDKNREAFDNLEATLKNVPIFEMSKDTTFTSSDDTKSSSSQTLPKPTPKSAESVNKLQTTETIEQQICYETFFKQKEVEIDAINKASSNFISMVVNKTFIKSQDKITVSSREQISRILKNTIYNKASQEVEKKKVMLISDDLNQIWKKDTEDLGLLDDIEHLSRKPKVASKLEKSKTFLKKDFSSKEKKTIDLLGSATSLPNEGCNKKKADVLKLKELPEAVRTNTFEKTFNGIVPKKTGLVKKGYIRKALCNYSLQQNSILRNEIEDSRKEAEGTLPKPIRAMNKKMVNDEGEEMVKKPSPQLRRTTKSEIRRKQITSIIPKVEHVKTPRQSVINIKKVDGSTVKLNVEQSKPKQISTGYSRAGKNQEKVQKIETVGVSVGSKKVAHVTEEEVFITGLDK